MAEDNKTITVDKEKLEGILKEFEELKKKTDLLEAVADKNEILKYMSRNRDLSKRTCRLRTLRYEDGTQKVVVSWPNMVMNEVFIGANGLSSAKQIVRLHMEDGTEETLEILEAGRRTDYIPATVLKRSKIYQDENGHEVLREIWEVKAETGKTYMIDTRFIN